MKNKYDVIVLKRCTLYYIFGLISCHKIWGQRPVLMYLGACHKQVHLVHFPWEGQLSQDVCMSARCLHVYCKCKIHYSLPFQNIPVCGILCPVRVHIWRCIGGSMLECRTCYGYADMGGIYLALPLSCIIEETYFHSSVLSNEPVCCLADYTKGKGTYRSFCVYSIEKMGRRWNMLVKDKESFDIASK